MNLSRNSHNETAVEPSPSSSLEPKEVSKSNPSMESHSTRNDAKKGRRRFQRLFQRKTKSEDDSTTKTSATIGTLEEELAQLRFLDDLDELQVYSNAFQYNFKEHVTKLLRNKTSKHKIILLSSDQQTELAEKLHQDYTEILLDQSIVGRHGVEVHLGAAKQLVDDFMAVQELVLQTGMPQTLQDTLFEALEGYIYPRIADHYNALDDLTPGDAAKIVSWTDDFVIAMEQRCPDVEIFESWSQDCERLVEHYLQNGVRREINELIGRSLSLQTNDDVRKDQNGHLVTGLPEHIAYIFQQQLTVAKDCLPIKYQERVLAACNSELAELVCDMMMNIGASWKGIGSSRFSSIINDASRIAEQCEERNRILLASPEYMEVGAALTCDLSELALHATKYLCERIMNDLKEPELILTSVGDIVWESNQQTQTAIARTIATLKDFFGDLEDWLISGYYFPKVLKYCFDLTLQTYVESFFSNTMANGVQDPSTAAYELDRDYLRLVVFFNGASFEKYHGVAGFYTQSVINERLRILQSLSNLINPEVPADETVDDVKAILKQFEDSESGTPAVLHLVGLRKRHRGNESIEWLRVIAKAKKAMDRDSCQALELSSSYTVPDL